MRAGRRAVSGILVGASLALLGANAALAEEPADLEGEGLPELSSRPSQAEPGGPLVLRKNAPGASASEVFGTEPGPLVPLDWTFEKAQAYLLSEDFPPDELEIVSREQWGAMPAIEKNMELMAPVSGVVFHHTASLAVPPKGDPYAIVKEVQREHLLGSRLKAKAPGAGCPVKEPANQATNAPGDIAYHFLIAQDFERHWRVVRGRETRFQGAHAGLKGCENLNVGMIGVAFVMNAEFRSEGNPTGVLKSLGLPRLQPPREALERAGQLMAWLKREFPGLARVYTHGAGGLDAKGDPLAINPGATSCPGLGIVPSVVALRKRFGS
jgi:hypothetical protein